jgi:CHAD domain-containing protein
LHELRRAIKRARYAAELAGAAGMPRTTSYVKRATTLQDLLGDHQDAVVAANKLSNMDRDLTRPAAHLAVAELTQLQNTRRAAARSAFPHAWRRLDKHGRNL